VLAELGGASAEQAVGRNPAAERDGLPGPASERPLELGDELTDDRRLIARREIRATSLNLALSQLPGRVEERRLQPAEAETEAGIAGHRDREVESIRTPVRGRALDRGPSRVAQAQEPSPLVQRLARRIVQRLAEGLDARLLPNAGEQRVAAARDQAQERRLERLGLEEVGRHVPLDMVDAHQRLAGGGG